MSLDASEPILLIWQVGDTNTLQGSELMEEKVSEGGHENGVFLGIHVHELRWMVASVLAEGGDFYMIEKQGKTQRREGDREQDVHQPTQSPGGPLTLHTQSAPGVSLETLPHRNKVLQGCSTATESMGKASKAQKPVWKERQAKDIPTGAKQKCLSKCVFTRKVSNCCYSMSAGKTCGGGRDH